MNDLYLHDIQMSNCFSFFLWLNRPDEVTMNNSTLTEHHCILELRNRFVWTVLLFTVITLLANDVFGSIYLYVLFVCEQH